MTLGSLSKWTLAALCWIAAAVPLRASAQAPQLSPRRGERRIVRSGMVERPDTLRTAATADSLAGAADAFGSLAGADSAGIFAAGADSLLISGADSVALGAADSLRTGSLLDAAFAEADSLARSLDSLQLDTARQDDSLRRKRTPFISDSMPLSRVCWISAVLPGFGQVYNKDYWKLPVLYGTLGASIGLFVHENKNFKPLKREYTDITDISTTRTPELDALQARMIRSNTRRQIWLGTAVASYIYFLGDAAVNYSTNDVSDVKKATTLACICPGAGQIYNKSYWKVPFVVGGFASMIYCIDWNNRGFQRFKKAYTLRAAYDKALEDYNQAITDHNRDPQNFPDEPDEPSPTDEFRGRYTASFLKNLKDSYRRNRDLCIILTGGLYLLQIIDAHVDAHLKDYDISDDLSMTVEPLIDYTYVPSAGGYRPTFGFSVGIKF